MKKHLWQYMRIISDRLEIIPVCAGANVIIKSPHPWTPDLWIDFLNADPEEARSLWPVYKKFARAMEDLIDGMDKAGIQYNDEIREMKLLSGAGFLANYGSLREDAKRLHESIKQAVLGHEADMLAFSNDAGADIIKRLGKIRADQRHSPVARFVARMAYLETRLLLLNGANIPPWITTITITNLTAAGTHDIGDTEIQVTIPKANVENFWLSNIVSGLVSSYTAGKVGRLCARADCDQFFIPYKRAPNQRFHSSSCKSTYHTRKRRLSNK